MSIDFDFSELDKLAADLGKVPDDAGKKIRQAVEVTSRHIKDSWAEKLQGATNLPRAAASVTYDLIAKPGETSRLEAEIGPELQRAQGPLVGLIEFGTPTLPPRGYGHEALRENEADFIKGLEIATEIVL